MIVPCHTACHHSDSDSEFQYLKSTEALNLARSKNQAEVKRIASIVFTGHDDAVDPLFSAQVFVVITVPQSGLLN